MHSLYGESKSVPGPVHARSCVSFCVCGEIRWASRKRKVTYCWPNFPWSALLSPSACQTSLLPHSKELRVCKDRGGGKGRKSEKVGGMKRGSPVQGAPASCRPGDGLDIASPLSSEKKTKRQWMLVNMLFYKAIPSITCNTDTYQKQTLYGSPLLLVIWTKYIKFPKHKQEPDASPCQSVWETCVVCQAYICMFVS